MVAIATLFFYGALYRSHTESQYRSVLHFILSMCVHWTRFEPRLATTQLAPLSRAYNAIDSVGYCVIRHYKYIHLPFCPQKKFNSAVDLCSTACPVNQCMWQRRTDKWFWILQFKKYLFTSIKPFQILTENWSNIYWKWDLRTAVLFFFYKIKLVKKNWDPKLQY